MSLERKATLGGCEDERQLSRTDSTMAESRVDVRFFGVRSFREKLKIYFINNQSSSLLIRLFNLIIKVLSCILYVVRVIIEEEYERNNAKPSGAMSRAIHSALSNIFESMCVQNVTDSVPNKSILGPLLQNNNATNGSVNWNRIVYIGAKDGGPSFSDMLWGIQIVVAIISLVEMIILTYLEYKGNILQQILSTSFFLEIITDVPFIVTATAYIYYDWRKVFVPVFLNCWLAKITLENILNDLHRSTPRSKSAFSQFMLILVATLVCLVFTSVCGLHHLQRGSYAKPLTLFDSLWFVIVTFSTVGYGDIYPDIWPSQLFVMFIVVAAIIVLPRQFEQLGSAWLESQKQGGHYSRRRAHNEKHVVVVVTVLHADAILDFLNEFYAHPKLEDYFVVLLSPCELDTTMKSLLQVPMWAARVVYVRGSALKDSDLSRCRMQDAEACFMIATRNYSDKNAADQHTILRSWAVKDFAPKCPQYVQIFRPENKFHVKFAEHVVCEDEFKYALLANNCLFPGVSTLVTLLLHTSRGEEGQSSSKQWMKLYGKHSGNEIYHVRLDQSIFFRDYNGKSFTYTSCHVHRKYGVALVGVQHNEPGATIQLNPGENYIMSGSDLCFYLSVNDEESAYVIRPQAENDGLLNRLSRRLSITPKSPNLTRAASSVACVVRKTEGNCYPETEVVYSTSCDNVPQDAAERTSLLSRDIRTSREKLGSVRALAHGTRSQYSKQTSIPLDLDKAASTDSTLSTKESCHLVVAETQNTALLIPMQVAQITADDLICDYPPVTPYIGTSPAKCHLMKQRRPLCCLQLSNVCEHCSFSHAREYNWTNRAIIIASDTASQGLYNFIVPLRSYVRERSSLNPIVLLLENPPAQSFLETLSHFPDVYWMKGNIESLDNLLHAGINFADNVVIVNKESSNSDSEDILADCNTIVAVQTIFRLFPSANIITELSQASNMRFMQFRAKDNYSFEISRQEKIEHDRGSQLYYMFRLPFAAGNVFSASMLDTLLYQAFVKHYMITFVRLLLGIDQAPGSGYLSCIKLSQRDINSNQTYGHLYESISRETGDIPIGIYRMESYDSNSHQLPSPEQDLSCTLPTCYDEKKEINQIVRCRMMSLGLPEHDYDDKLVKQNHTSYVIINPTFDLLLQAEDIIYVLRPGIPSLSIPKVNINQPESSPDRSSLVGNDDLHNDEFSPVHNASFLCPV